MKGAWVADPVEHSSLLPCPRWRCEEERKVIFKDFLLLRRTGIAFIAALLFTLNNPGVKATSGALPLPVLCVSSRCLLTHQNPQELCVCSVLGLFLHALGLLDVCILNPVAFIFSDLIFLKGSRKLSQVFRS